MQNHKRERGREREEKKVEKKRRKRRASTHKHERVERLWHFMDLEQERRDTYWPMLQEVEDRTIATLSPRSLKTNRRPTRGANGGVPRGEEFRWSSDTRGSKVKHE